MHVTHRDLTRTVAHRLHEYNKTAAQHKLLDVIGSNRDKSLAQDLGANTYYKNDGNDTSRRHSSSEESSVTAASFQQRILEAEDVSDTASQLSDLPSVVPFCLSTDVPSPPSSDHGSADGNLDWSSWLLANERYSWKTGTWLPRKVQKTSVESGENEESCELARDFATLSASRVASAPAANEKSCSSSDLDLSTLSLSLAVLAQPYVSKPGPLRPARSVDSHHKLLLGSKPEHESTTVSAHWLPDDVQDTLAFIALLDTIDPSPNTGWTTEMASHAAQQRYSRSDEWTAAKVQGGSYDAFKHIEAELMEYLRAALGRAHGFQGRVAEAADARTLAQMKRANEVMDEIDFEPTLQTWNQWHDVDESRSVVAEEEEDNGDADSDLLGEYPEVGPLGSAQTAAAQEDITQLIDKTHNKHREQNEYQEAGAVDDKGDIEEIKDHTRPQEFEEDNEARLEWQATSADAETELERALDEFSLFTGLL